MPAIRMILSEEARLFLLTECREEELEAFRVCSQMIREDPIRHSELYRGRTNAQYQPRFFRFGGCLAFIHYFITGDRRTEHIEVTACRRSKPRRNEP